MRIRRILPEYPHTISPQSQSLKKASRIPISSYTLEHTDLDINPHMHHRDMLLQYEEIKRKLYETYMISFQLLKTENNRLKNAIAKSKKQFEYFQSIPKIKLHIIPNCLI